MHGFLLYSFLGKKQMNSSRNYVRSLIGILSIVFKVKESNYKVIVTYKKKEKEIECMNQFANQSKKESYAHLKGIINDKFQLNFRVMNSNLVSTLTNFEDKFGNFKHI